ncbi:MAG: DUF1192 domain-containing protein [Alphaproteobacteria bacterium]
MSRRPNSKPRMLTDDDTDPKTRRARPRPLDNMSVPDLKEYVLQLQAEIARAEAEMAKKEKHKNAADAIFKTK